MKPWRDCSERCSEGVVEYRRRVEVSSIATTSATSHTATTLHGNLGLDVPANRYTLGRGQVDAAE